MVWTLKLILEQLFQPEITFLQAACYDIPGWYKWRCASGTVPGLCT